MTIFVGRLHCIVLLNQFDLILISFNLKIQHQEWENGVVDMDCLG